MPRPSSSHFGDTPVRNPTPKSLSESCANAKTKIDDIIETNKVTTESFPLVDGRSLLELQEYIADMDAHISADESLAPKRLKPCHHYV